MVPQCHGSGDKRQPFPLLQLWGQTLKSRGQLACAFQRLQGRAPPCLWQLLVARMFLDCGGITPVRLPGHMVEPRAQAEEPTYPQRAPAPAGPQTRWHLPVRVTGQAVPGVPRPGLPGRRRLWPWAPGAGHPPPHFSFLRHLPRSSTQSSTAGPADSGRHPFEGSWFCPCVRTASPIVLFMEQEVEGTLGSRPHSGGEKESGQGGLTGNPWPPLASGTLRLSAGIMH